MKTHLDDGLYVVRHPNFTAGFVVENGEVTTCAPILRRNLVYWQAWAIKLETDPALQRPLDEKNLKKYQQQLSMDMSSSSGYSDE